MERKETIKWTLLFVMIVFAVLVVQPQGSAIGKWFQKASIRTGIRLGLDIQGGSSITVQIDVDKIREQIKADKPDATDKQIQDQVDRILKDSQDRVLEVLRNRVDRLGVSEPAIYGGKDNRITIQLPGIDEKKRADAERILKESAFLEFKLVHKRNSDLTKKLFDAGLAPEGYAIRKFGDEMLYVRDRNAVPDPLTDAFYRKLGTFHVPDSSYEFMLEKVDRYGQEAYRPAFVAKKAELTGDSLKGAGVDMQGMGQNIVTLEFDSQGAKKFGQITKMYAPNGEQNPDSQRGRQLAIVMDGRLYSAPELKAHIVTGNAIIEQGGGGFPLQEARFLANILSSGALPAPLKIVEKRSVDPTLGQDAVSSGVKAGALGCLAIVVLMLMYYRLNGVISNVALLLNVVLLPLGAVIVSGFLDIIASGQKSGSIIALPVLTLPGIAGIALTVGMAVDANVLILERMREELRSGKGFLAAIQAGYERAFTAIFDSNLTTIITAVILFILGSGPIRGYAVTLTAGLLVSLFTAVVVTRMCYTAMSRKTSETSVLKMVSFFPQTNINFIGAWKIAVATSLVVIVATWSLMVYHGRKNTSSVFGVDFLGGSSVTMSFEQKQKVEDIRSALAATGIGDATIQYQSEHETGKEYLHLKVASMEDSTKARATLNEKFPAAKFVVMQEDSVGPLVGDETKAKATKAMIFALIAMVIYLWWRFELGFGIGAVVALFHDVMVTAGICHLFGFQMSVTMVAALLTIVGYSVNDTIVIFDRIREDLRLVRNKTFTELCNQSINETLARTIITNFLTFVSVLFLLVMGGGSIRDFSFAMFVGMISGTYSTVYVATPVVLWWYKNKAPELGK